MTPKYGHFSKGEGNLKTYLDQGKITGISSWGITNDSGHLPFANRIRDFSWISDHKDVITVINTNQSDINYVPCKPFILDENDYINGYRVMHKTYIWHLEFLTAFNKSYECPSITIDTAWIDTGMIKYVNFST